MHKTFLQAFRFYLLILFFIPQFIFAIQRPWANTGTAVSPWGHNERQEARESWFQGLNGSSLAFPKPSESREPVAAEKSQTMVATREPNIEERSDIPDSSDLSEIPWQSYEEEFPNDAFRAKLMWPVESGRLSSGYGFRNGRVHEGIDISASLGNTIRAAADGRVVYSGYVDGYGKIVVVYHGRGVASVYAHNAVNLKRRGDKVRQGDSIAHVGKSGDATGAHCHFEIRENGKPTNPLRFTYIESPLFAQK